jgi:hypothetical protein
MAVENKKEDEHEAAAVNAEKEKGIGKTASGIRQKTTEKKVAAVLAKDRFKAPKTPMPTINCAASQSSSEIEEEEPPLSIKYQFYLCRLIPLSQEIKRLQDRDGAVETARNEAELAQGKLAQARQIVKNAYDSVVTYKPIFHSVITESRRAKSIRSKALTAFADASKKIAHTKKAGVSGQVDWPELEYYDVRASMPLSDVSRMAEELSAIIENFGDVVKILKKHLEDAESLRDKSKAEFKQLQKNIQNLVTLLESTKKMSVLDIYEAVERHSKG